MRPTGATAAVLFLVVIAAATAGGAYLGMAVAGNITEPGVQTVLLEDPAQFTDIPDWASRSDAGFTGFGGLPALPGVVFRSGVIVEHRDGAIVVDSASARTTVDYSRSLRFFQIRRAGTPLAVGDSVIVRLVDGNAAGFLRLLVEIDELEE